MKYPNLELLEYKTRVALFRDPVFCEKLEAAGRDKKYCEMEVTVFPQMWGSTCTGFDVAEDGGAVLGGCAMTKEYTSVFHELLTDTWVVFFGDKMCYMVTNAKEVFYEDLVKKSMASLSEAKKRY